MTEVYGGLWPALVESAYGSCPSVLKWTHSIIFEPTFMTEWQARETARGLALEMAQCGVLERLSVSSPLATFRKKGTNKKVSFSIGLDDGDPSFPVNRQWHAENVPGLVSYKPDPADQAQLPDPVEQPDRGRDQGVRGQTLLDRPYWQQQVWQLLQQEGRPDDDDDDPVLYMYSYFICHLAHRRQERGRPLRFDREIDSWEQAMRFVWEDLEDPTKPIWVYLVEPEPAFSVAPGTFGTLLIVQNPNPFRAACLVTSIEPAIPRFRITEAAHSFDIVMPFRHILFLSGVAQVCDERRAQFHEYCDILVGRRILPPGAPVRVHEGLGLTIQIPPPAVPADWEQQLVNQIAQRPVTHWPAEETVEEDAMSLMARRPSAARRTSSSASESTSTSMTASSSRPSARPDEDWRQTVIFGLDGRSAPASLPWHDSSLMIDQVAISLNLERNEILRIQAVYHLPPDFAQVNLHGLLLQRSTEFRPTPYDRLVLVDRELHVANEIQPTPFNRGARWVPYMATREAILAALGLHELCQHHAEVCHLWHNNIVIEGNSALPISISDGDYLRVFVGELEPDICLSDLELLSNATATTIDDLTMLFQTALSHQRPHNAPVTLKTAPQHEVQPSRFDGSTPTNPEPPPRRTTRNFVRGDRRRLEQLFEEESFLECTEEGRVAYIDTWYVHHSAEWLEEILALWEDLLEPESDASIHLVKPPPPCARTECVLAHLIVEQAPRPQRVVGLITTYAESQWRQHGAHCLFTA